MKNFNCTVVAAAQQANISASGGGGSGGNIPDIPIVTEPDYPERVPTVPSSLGGSIFARTHGTNERSNKLAVAPLLDVSSSGADDGFFLLTLLSLCLRHKLEGSTFEFLAHKLKLFSGFFSITINNP